MTTNPLSRRAFLQAAAAGLLHRSGRAWSAGAHVPVEDWRGAPVGSNGVPAGWQKYETPGGHPAYDFTVVDRAGNVVDGKRVSISVDPPPSGRVHDVQVSDIPPPQNPRR